MENYKVFRKNSRSENSSTQVHCYTLINMEIAVSTLFCLHKPFTAAMMDVIETGIKNVEIVDDGLHIINNERIDKLLELKDEYGLNYSLHAPFTDVNLAAYDPNIRTAIQRRLKATVCWASKLGVEIMVFHPGNSTAIERYMKGIAWKINLKSINEILNYADQKKIVAAIENVPDPFPFLLKSVRDFQHFFNDLNREVKMVLDLAHSNIRGESHKFVKTFQDKIVHIHVSDNNGDSDRHLQLGKGIINWSKTIESLEKIRYNGWITVESYSGVKESINLLREYV